jgi:putative ABC transport system substrate-binding protein
MSALEGGICSLRAFPLLTQLRQGWIEMPQRSSLLPDRGVLSFCEAREGPAVRRREFITLVGGAAAWPLAARAQQAERVRRVGMLIAGSDSDREGQRRLAAFREELERLGWAEPRNIRIDMRWAAPGDTQSNQRFAKELVALQPDLLVSSTTPPTAALLQQTRTIPIISISVNDPISGGFVESFPRPRGNATGFVILEPTIGGKWLEMLKEVAPKVERVAALFNPAQAPTAEYYLSSVKAAAASLSVEAKTVHVRNVSELESIVAAQASAPNSGLIVLPDAFFTAHRVEITSLATRHRLPAIYPWRYFAELGGLLSYGSDLIDSWRRAAGYVDGTLKGAKPSGCPFRPRSSSSW